MDEHGCTAMWDRWMHISEKVVQQSVLLSFDQTATQHAVHNTPLSHIVNSFLSCRMSSLLS